LKKSSVKEPVLRDVGRQDYDLSHWSFQIGAMGSLQTLACVPIVAGDSMQLNASIVARLSPLRRNLYLDSVVDLAAFYIPHRHIYGDDWINFILGGEDEAVTLGTDTLAAGVKLNCVGLRTSLAAVLPRWLTRGYIQIWNRYFRDPSDVAGILAENFFTTIASSDVRQSFGIPICHLKSMTTATMESRLTTGDYRLPLDTGEVNLLQFAQLQSRLQTEQARDYSGFRYTDLLKHTWDTGVNTDADKRPTLIARSTQWLSGYDVDATDTDALGTFSGKAQAILKLSFPFRFFPEHGPSWFCGCVC